MLNIDGKENINNFILKICVYLNLWRNLLCHLRNPQILSVILSLLIMFYIWIDS